MQTDIIDVLKAEHIVFSNKPSRKAAFIMNDGSFLNLDENKRQITGIISRDVIHSDLSLYLWSKDIANKKDDYFLVRHHNAIRINDGTSQNICEEPLVTLPKELNMIQCDSMLKWLDHLFFETNKTRVHIGIVGTNVLKTFDFARKDSNGLLPEDIIKEIKHLDIILL